MFIKGARAIFDNEVYQYIKDVASELWNDPDHNMTFSDVEEFKTKYVSKINEYKHSKLLGLEHFKHTMVTDGVTGSFLDWYIEHGKDNLVVLKGEYPFHERNGIKVLEHFTQIEKGKTLILSLPFSATGGIHSNYFSILEWCGSNDINVLIDAAYLNISGIGEIPILHKSIKSVATSLSKVYNTGMNKIGIRFDIEKPNTPTQQLNDWSYVNHHSINLHSSLMDKYSLSYIYDKYKDSQIDICNQEGMLASETVIFGLSTDDKFKEYNRAGIINRVCLSKEMKNANNSQ